jgi:hypothetical protein
MCVYLPPRLKSRILHSLIRATGFPLPWKRIRAQYLVSHALADLPQKVMKTQIIYARHANFELLFCLRARVYIYEAKYASAALLCDRENV